LALAVLCIAAGSGGLRHFYGSSLTTLNTGHVFVSTNNPVSFWVGGSTSNPVMVGSAAWSNNVTASVTNGLASTNFVNSAVAIYPVTNAWNTLSLVITNSHPGTNAWLRSDDGTNLYWQAAP
jgi:hypothetical protein